MENTKAKTVVITVLVIIIIGLLGVIAYSMFIKDNTKVQADQMETIERLKSEIDSKDAEIAALKQKQVELNEKIDAFIKGQSEVKEDVETKYIRNYSLKNGDTLYIDKDGYLYLTNGTKVENIKPTKVFFTGDLSKSIAIVGEDGKLYVIDDIFKAKINKPLGDSKIKNIKYGYNGFGVSRTVFTAENGKKYDFANGDYVFNSFQKSNKVYNVQNVYEEAELNDMEKPRG